MINELDLELLIPKEKIQKRVAEIASTLCKEYKGKPLVLVAVMKGAICLLADLMRLLPLDVEFALIQCQSYGMRGTKRGNLEMQELIPIRDPKEHHLLIIDDIFDSGITLEGVITHYKQYTPLSIQSLVLLSNASQKEGSLKPNYTLFEIEDYFVVGYGLDYKEKGRGLPDIYAVKNKAKT